MNAATKKVFDRVSFSMTASTPTSDALLREMVRSDMVDLDRGWKVKEEKK